MKIVVNGMVIETERHVQIKEHKDHLELIADFINTLSPERKAYFLSLVKQPGQPTPPCMCFCLECICPK